MAEKMTRRERRMWAAAENCPGSPDGHLVGPRGVRCIDGGVDPEDPSILVRVTCRWCGREGEAMIESKNVAFQLPTEEEGVDAPGEQTVMAKGTSQRARAAAIGRDQS